MASDRIYQGFWIDHSKVQVLGATLTLKANWGQQLVSAAAILVQIAGLAAWNIIAFWIHQSRAGPGLRDEYESQLQVLLRNSWGADGAAWNLFSLARTWSGRRANVWRSVLPLALLPALLYVAFVVAGVFVGQIATSDPIVLVAPSSACGYIDTLSTFATTAGTIGYAALNQNLSSLAMQYARSCYNGAGSLSSISCSVYPVQKLDYNIEYDQTCPIPFTGACMSSDDPATPIKLISKKLDSHEDLGINAPEEDRLTLQYSTTCAPLDYTFVNSHVAERTLTTNDTGFFGSHSNNATVLDYNFGTYRQFDFCKASLWSYVPMIRYWGIGILGYTVETFQSTAPHTNSTFSSQWTPTAPFNLTEGDLTVFFLAPNSVSFAEQINGPLFRTNTTTDTQILGGAQWIPEQNVYVIACSHQYQICSRKIGKCTAFGGMNDIDNYARWLQELKLSDRQFATFSRLATLVQNSNMHIAVDSVPDSLLASNYLISTSTSQGLPDNQWEIEVEGWFQTALSRFQLIQSIYPSIPVDMFKQNNVAYSNPGALWKAFGQDGIANDFEKQCHQQRVTAPQQYQSYNLFALVFIAFITLLLVGLALFLKKAHRVLPGVDPQGAKYLSYRGESLLQLHRMALEGAGYGGWEGGVNEDPRTAVVEKRLPQVAMAYDGLDGLAMLRYPKAGEFEKESDRSTERVSGVHEEGLDQH